MNQDKPASSLAPDSRKAVLGWLGSLPVDLPHLLQVTRLALDLFDAGVALHQEGSAARKLLEAGALLHDVGFSIEEKSHHKHSRDMILKWRIPGFTEHEMCAVACLARYHRKAVPSNAHALFAQLEPALQRTVERLSAILRVADGLDRSHQARVRIVRSRITPTEMILYLETAGDIGTDFFGFEKKKSYFETLFKKRLRLEFEQVPFGC